MRIGVTGHLIIPASAIDYVRRGITATLDRVPAELVGITSLADGADQLFAELILERAGSLHVILPCAASCESERFNSLLKQAAAVETLNFAHPSEDAYLAAGRRMVDLSEAVIAIWDGLPARGKGGTGDVVQYAIAQGKPVEVIWPAGLTRL